jgi:glycolate oxidase
MTTPTTENITALDDSLVESFTKAVAGRAEVVTDDAVMTDRGHDF